jgi:hypothetical protein
MVAKINAPAICAIWHKIIQNRKEIRKFLIIVLNKRKYPTFHWGVGSLPLVRNVRNQQAGIIKTFDKQIQKES